MVCALIVNLGVAKGSVASKGVLVVEDHIQREDDPRNVAKDSQQQRNKDFLGEDGVVGPCQQEEWQWRKNKRHDGEENLWALDPEG